MSKIDRMNMVELTAHAERLALEASRVGAKLERLKAHKPCPVERVAAMEQQIQRLIALEKLTRNRLAAKESRAAARPQGGHGGGGPHRSNFGGPGPDRRRQF